MISKAKWQTYIQKLAAIDEKAAEMIRQYIDTNGLENSQELIEYAYGIVTKYGEASAELSCEMYDLMAENQGVVVPPAEPADTATIDEVARGVQWGKYHSPNQIPSIVGRQTRQAGADTMIKNAIRDQVEWAWIPSGDTCAFCITLASRGWQRASKKVLKGDHAEHIHANCDCTFGIAFNQKGKQEYDYIYDPQKYAAMYYGADGRTPTDKINSIRRARYQLNKDYINAQKRDAYQAKMYEKSRRKPGSDETAIISPVIEKSEYKGVIDRIDEDKYVTNTILHQGRTTLYHRNGTKEEDMVFIDPIRHIWKAQRNYNVDGEVVATDEMKEMLQNSKTKSIIAVHNHPHSNLPSLEDLLAAKDYKYGVILCHNGVVYKYEVSSSANLPLADSVLNEMQTDMDEGRKYDHHFAMLENLGVKLEMFI